MGRTELIIAKACFLANLQLSVFFRQKMAGKGVFFEKKELSLSIFHSLLLPGLQVSVISKMMGSTELMLCEGMFPSRLSIVNVFQAKNGRKGNFSWKKKNLLYRTFFLLFCLAFRVL